MLASITLLHAACALLYAVLAALIAAQARHSRTGLLLGLACLGTAVWAATVALVANPAWGSVLDLMRALVWYGFVLHLYRKSTEAYRRSVAGNPGQAGRRLDESELADAGLVKGGLVEGGPGGRFGGHRLLTAAVLGLAALGAVAMLLPMLHEWQPGWASWDPVSSVGGLAMIAGLPVPALVVAVRLGLAVCTVLLIENLYRNTAPEMRWHINLLCIALGGMFVYDILLAADTALFHRVSTALFEGRAVAMALVAPLLAVAAARNRAWAIDIHVSRAAAFHSATLVASGVLLMSLAAAGELARRFGVTRFGADWGGVVEVGLVFAGLIVVAVLVTSGRARSRLRALVVDNFFSHRYDYRREWSRCIETLSVPSSGGPSSGAPGRGAPGWGAPGSDVPGSDMPGRDVSGPEGSDADGGIGLHRRVIRAVAGVVDAPGGVLFLRDADETAFQWAGSWNLPAVAAPVMPDHPLVLQFRDGSWIVPLDRLLLQGGGADGEEIAGLQLAVPLAHGRSGASGSLGHRSPADHPTANHLPGNGRPGDGQLVGFILVAAPRAAFKLDGEVFDLLRMVAAEVARTIVEQRLTRSLVQTRQLHEYGKRFAFVAHDIKNVSNQLALLLANAETHIENPEFQRDMLATVRASVQKINVMIKRLQDPATGSATGAATGAAGSPGTMGAAGEAVRDLGRLVVPAERLAALIHPASRPAPFRRVVLETDGGQGDVAMQPAAFDAVVTHLVNNALEASASEAGSPRSGSPRSGSPEFGSPKSGSSDAPVQVRLRHEARRVIVDVVDHGCGMSPEFVRDALFQPFRTSKGSGTGIGAYQARELLREAGGDLVVISQPDEGTTMRIMLPVLDLVAPVALPGVTAPAVPAPGPATGADPFAVA